jgi:spore germination protein YaaH
MKKFFYRVLEGDSLVNLCQKFNCSLGKLIFKNNLKKEISAGDILLIESSDNLYYVKPTDTLKELAKRFNKSEQDILENNHLDYLFCGIYIEI